MEPGGPHGVKRLVRALFCALSGFADTLRHEEAFRIEIASALIAIPLAFWFGHTPGERALLVSVILLVLVTELLNTAVEAVVDRFGDEHHPLSRRAKDVAAAAVLMALVNAAIVWFAVIIW